MNLPYSLNEVEHILREKGWTIPISNKFLGIYKSLGVYSKNNIKVVSAFDAWNIEFNN